MSATFKYAIGDEVVIRDLSLLGHDYRGKTGRVVSIGVNSDANKNNRPYGVHVKSDFGPGVSTCYYGDGHLEATFTTICRQVLND